MRTRYVGDDRSESVRLSVVIPVLESYEVVKRQLLHLAPIFPDDAELIIVDDGSKPCILDELRDEIYSRRFRGHYDPETEIERLAECYNSCHLISKPEFRFTVIETFDYQPWSQPRAHNTGAKYAIGEFLFFTDIDHILTKEALEFAVQNTHDKAMFPRKFAVLDEQGKLQRDIEILKEYGCIDRDENWQTCHENTFVIRKSIFDELGGYDEKFCGHHGGDDTDFNRRYGALHYAGKCERHIMGALIYVFPDPARDVKKLFHKLR